MALSYICSHHLSEPATSLITATLLLTDPRWRNGVGQLARQVADADILEPDALDLLAESFVAADEFVYWQVPDSWFGDDYIEIDLTDGGDPRPATDSTDSVAPTVARRTVHPPLRRWASARVVRRDPTAWSHLFARAREIDRRGGAALMSGLLDSIDALAAPTQTADRRRGRMAEPGRPPARTRPDRRPRRTTGCLRPGTQ